VTNADLQGYYRDFYRDKPYEFPTDESAEMIAALKWRGKAVLEIGCGEGALASMIAEQGADITACDYALPENRAPGPKYDPRDFRLIFGQFDSVVMNGVLEHFEKPYDTLEFIRDRYEPGEIINASPSFLNPRGYVWMALQLLFDVPMSLTDIHFICPFDMEEWAKSLGADLEYWSVDQERGHGEPLLVDFEKRLTNALKDREANVPAFLEWLRKTVDYTSYAKFSGANVVYRLTF